MTIDEVVGIDLFAGLSANNDTYNPFAEFFHEHNMTKKEVITYFEELNHRMQGYEPKSEEWKNSCTPMDVELLQSLPEIWWTFNTSGIKMICETALTYLHGGDPFPGATYFKNLAKERSQQDPSNF